MLRYFILLALVCSIVCKPLENSDTELQIDSTQLHNKENAQTHNIEKRFINPMFNLGSGAGIGLAKLRTRRSYDDDCERLQLCKLHVKSHYNFFAAYELYFVNKENARLWDHRSRSMADCESRYGDCYKK